LKIVFDHSLQYLSLPSYRRGAAESCYHAAE